MRRMGLSLLAALGLGLSSWQEVLAQAKNGTQSAKVDAKAKADTKAKADAKAKADTKAEADAKAEADSSSKVEKSAAAEAEPDDPTESSSAKFLPSEVFREPLAEKLLDVKRYNELRARNVTPSELAALEEMASQPNMSIDRTLMEHVVEGLAARLTNHANLQAVIDPPPNLAPSSPTNQAISEAAKALMRPIFVARSVRNMPFLVAYDRVLLQKLRPLLNGHLITRIEAMIVLGESATPEDLPLFLTEIRNPNQTIWVKLWALRGLSMIVRNGGRLNPASQFDAAKVVSDFLEREQNLPWPLQYRGVQVLAEMRQGFVPAQPRSAHMASTAMRLLTDGSAKYEVRAEAARALGLMQITSAVPRYNYNLVACATGELVAEIGDQIASVFKSNKIKARALAVLLAGPIDQAFTGDPMFRDSGLLKASAGPAAAYIQKVYQLTRAVTKVSADLMVTLSKQVPNRLKELRAQVAELRAFLEKNPPADRRLVQGGQEYPKATPPAAAGPAAAVPSRPTAVVHSSRR